jgi:hypothetical protein
MNGSCVTAKIAGMESTAKNQIGGLDECKHDEERGRKQLPCASDLLANENFCPAYSRVTGISRRTMRMTGFDAGSMSCSAVVAMRIPVNTRKAPNTYMTQ